MGSVVPPLPPVLLGGAYLEAFMDVGPAQPGAAGPVPLSYFELAAWIHLSGREYAPWEVELFRAMSAAYCDARSRGEEPGAAPPWVAPAQTDRAEVASRLRAAFSARAKPGVRTTTENRA
jgi:hypothetical protein